MIPVINKTQLLYLLVFSVLLFTVDDSFAVSDFTVQIPRDSYVSNDTVYLTGTLYAPSGTTLTIKIYDGEAKITWISKIPISSSDKEFSETIILSGSDWTSGLYIILAEIDHEIVSTTFTFEYVESDVVTTPIPIVSEPIIVEPRAPEPIAPEPRAPEPRAPEPRDIDTDLISQPITSNIIQKTDEEKPSNSNDSSLLLIITLIFVIALMLLYFIISKIKSTKTQMPEIKEPEIKKVKLESEPIKETFNFEVSKDLKSYPIEIPATSSRQSFELTTLTNLSTKKLKFPSFEKKD